MKNKIDSIILEWSQGKVAGFQGKNLIDLDNGSIKLVKIEPLANYPEHIHPNKTEFTYVLDGTPEFIIDGFNYRGKKDDFFIFHVAVKHAILNTSDKQCLIIVGAINT